MLLALLPFAVAAVHLVLRAGDFFTSGDLALMEMQVRDITHHPVLVGLYSRDTWSHPGPMLFYLLAPFYWLTGGSPVGLYLGGLAINAGAVAGMAHIARRRGGTPLLLCTLLAVGLLVRTFGGDRFADPWVCYVTVLPFALLLFLTWSMMSGDRWALPASVVVGSFLAQTHVGFLPIALPLVLWGAVWLAWPNLRARLERRRVAAVVPATSDGGADPLDDHPPEAETTTEPTGRSLRWYVALSLGLAFVLWLPPLLDLAFSTPSNAGDIVRWFTEAKGGVRTLGNGWHVITGQFGWHPEWIVGKRRCTWGTCEAPYTYHSPFPWLLIIAGVAAVALWRHRPSSRGMIVTFGLAVVLGIVAVARTIGPIVDYRYYWTWVPGMVGAALILWAGWVMVTRRRAELGDRLLAPLAMVGLAVLSVVNVVVATTAGIPHEVDSTITRTLLPAVLDTLREEGGPDDGVVVMGYPFGAGMFWARGLTVQLERRGYDVRIGRRTDDLGDHRYHRDEPVQAQLWVLSGNGVESGLRNPRLRLLAEWHAPFSEAELEAGDVPDIEGFDVNGTYGDMGALDVAVFIEE